MASKVRDIMHIIIVYTDTMKATTEFRKIELSKEIKFGMQPWLGSQLIPYKLSHALNPLKLFGFKLRNLCLCCSSCS
jgi:hypothetical protein